MAFNENRRSKRSSHDSVLELFDASGHMIAGIGRLVNVSTVGICFSSTASLAKGDAIRGRLRLLREGVLEISGHVVWVKNRLNTIQYGVAFDDITPLS